MKKYLETLLLAPHISEKATRIEADRQYVFKVRKDANKFDVKHAIEKMFKVKVEQVRICNVKPKQKHFRNKMGWRKGWKKAYVSLQEGHKINLAGKA